MQLHLLHSGFLSHLRYQYADQHSPLLVSELGFRMTEAGEYPADRYEDEDQDVFFQNPQHGADP